MSVETPSSSCAPPVHPVDAAAADQALVKARRRLEEIEPTWRALTGARFAAVLLTDDGGFITFANERAAELARRPIEALVGTALTELLVDGFAALQQAAAAGAQLGDGRDGELKDADGRSIPLHFSAVALDLAAGAPTGYLVVAVERDHHQRERCQRKLTEKLEAVGRLADGIAHEINTPLQFIGGTVRVLHEALVELRALRPAPAEDDAALDDAANQALAGLDRIAGIIRSTREIAARDGGRCSPSDLNRLIESAASLARHAWERHAALEFDLAPALPKVSLRAGMLADALMHLISNAALAIATRREQEPGLQGSITLRTRRTGDSAEIAVVDNGCGIAPAIADRVFEPFFTTRKLGSSAGQGLAIVHHVVVREHGGTVRFETVPGSGTTFVLRIPLAREVRP